MGGRVLEYEAKRIKREGILEGKREVARRMHTKGADSEDIADTLEVELEQVEEWLAAAVV